MILRELLSSFGLDFDQSGFNKANDAFDALTKRAQAFGQLAIGGALAVGLARLVDDSARAAGELEDTGRKVGVAVEALQELRYAAKLAGAGADEMDFALYKLGRSAAEATTGNKSAAAAFAKLGIHLKDAQGHLRGTDQLLEEVADGLHKIRSEGERAAVAQDLLGLAGGRLLPALTDGKAAIHAFREEARKLGIVLSKDEVHRLGELDDQLDRINFAFTGLKNTIALAVLPVAQRLADFLTFAIVKFNEFEKATGALSLALVALGTTAFVIGAGMIAPFLPFLLEVLAVGAAVSALVLIIEDLQKLFTGQKSFIGAWLDDLIGVGTAADVARVAMEGLKRAIEGIRLIMHEGLGGAIDTRLNLTPGTTGTAAKNALVDSMFPGAGLLLRGAQSVFGGGEGAKGPQYAYSPTPTNGAQLTVQSTNTFHISGAGDPSKVGDEVEERMRARDEAARRDAQDALQQLHELR